MKKLKVRGYQNVLSEETIDVFTQATLDNTILKLEVKETGNCIIRTNFQVIGWTNDVHFAFDVFNNSVPISTYEEIFHNLK